MKIKLEKLSSAKFIYPLHSMDNVVIDYSKAVGYCEGSNTILPKRNTVAVMFEDSKDEREKWWIHFLYDTFNRHYEGEENFIEQPQSIEEFAHEFETTSQIHQQEQRKNKLIKHVYAEEGGVFQRNLASVSCLSNKNGRMYFVRVASKNPEENFWWAYNRFEAEDNPDEVKVVNTVGGFHYKNFTRRPLIQVYNGLGDREWQESEYEFIQALDREQADVLFNQLLERGIKLDYLGKRKNES